MDSLMVAPCRLPVTWCDPSAILIQQIHVAERGIALVLLLVDRNLDVCGFAVNLSLGLDIAARIDRPGLLHADINDVLQLPWLAVVQLWELHTPFGT